jgi:hypothetical protein
MSDQRLTHSLEKTTQRMPYRENRPASVPTVPGGLHPLLDLQRTIGNHAVGRLLQAQRLTPQGTIHGLQRGLTVGAANDRYEQEADRVADQVMRMPDPAVARSSIDPTPIRPLSIQRKCQGCEDEKKLRRHTQTPHTENPGSGLDTVAATLRQGGRPLDASTRSFFEPRFGVDFSAVRIHTDTQASRSAEAINALAYTAGHNVIFRRGYYDPSGDSGRRLLAHELTHVVQQGGSAPGKVLRQDAGISVRSPTLEIAALRSQQFMSFGGSPLLPAERSIAASVFGSSLNLDAVRIVYSTVVAAPTTLGNSIRVPPGYTMPHYVLIHELTHIWQYQAMGSGYISDSLWHQTAATVSSLVTTGTADRSGAYRYTIVRGQNFNVYSAEQQASIVEDFFLSPTLQADPEYRRLIAQVRAARPLNVGQAFWEERAAGLPPRQWAVPNPREPGFGAEGGSVPQLEFRFPGL